MIHRLCGLLAFMGVAAPALAQPANLAASDSGEVREGLDITSHGERVRETD